MFAGNGTGSAADWGYCSSSRPCAHREGDCDNDSECAQDHVCGDNNCINYWNLAETEADCCIPGNLNIMTKNDRRNSGDMLLQKETKNDL